MKKYIGMLVNETSHKSVKVIVHTLFEAEAKLAQIAKNENMIVEDIMEID